MYRLVSGAVRAHAPRISRVWTGVHTPATLADAQLQLRYVSFKLPESLKQGRKGERKLFQDLKGPRGSAATDSGASGGASRTTSASSDAGSGSAAGGPRVRIQKPTPTENIQDVEHVEFEKPPIVDASTLVTARAEADQQKLDVTSLKPKQRRSLFAGIDFKPPTEDKTCRSDDGASEGFVAHEPSSGARSASTHQLGVDVPHGFAKPPTNFQPSPGTSNGQSAKPKSKFSLSGIKFDAKPQSANSEGFGIGIRGPGRAGLKSAAYSEPKTSAGGQASSKPVKPRISDEDLDEFLDMLEESHLEIKPDLDPRKVLADLPWDKISDELHNNADPLLVFGKYSNGAIGPAGAMDDDEEPLTGKEAKKARREQRLKEAKAHQQSQSGHSDFAQPTGTAEDLLKAQSEYEKQKLEAIQAEAGFTRLESLFSMTEQELQQLLDKPPQYMDEMLNPKATEEVKRLAADEASTRQIARHLIESGYAARKEEQQAKREKAGFKTDIDPSRLGWEDIEPYLVSKYGKTVGGRARLRTLEELAHSDLKSMVLEMQDPVMREQIMNDYAELDAARTYVALLRSRGEDVERDPEAEDEVKKSKILERYETAVLRRRMLSKIDLSKRVTRDELDELRKDVRKALEEVNFDIERLSEEALEKYDLMHEATEMLEREAEDPYIDAWCTFLKLLPSRELQLLAMRAVDMPEDPLELFNECEGDIERIEKVILQGEEERMRLENIILKGLLGEEAKAKAEMYRREEDMEIMREVVEEEKAAAAQVISEYLAEKKIKRERYRKIAEAYHGATSKKTIEEIEEEERKEEQTEDLKLPFRSILDDQASQQQLEHIMRSDPLKVTVPKKFQKRSKYQITEFETTRDPTSAPLGNSAFAVIAARARSLQTRMAIRHRDAAAHAMRTSEKELELKTNAVNAARKVLADLEAESRDNAQRDDEDDDEITARIDRARLNLTKLEAALAEAKQEAEKARADLARAEADLQTVQEIVRKLASSLPTTAATQELLEILRAGEAAVGGDSTTNVRRGRIRRKDLRLAMIAASKGDRAYAALSEKDAYLKAKAESEAARLREQLRQQNGIEDVDRMLFGRVVASYGPRVLVEQVANDAYVNHRDFFSGDKVTRSMKVLADKLEKLYGKDSEDMGETGNASMSSHSPASTVNEVSASSAVPNQAEAEGENEGEGEEDPTTDTTPEKPVIGKTWQCIKSRHLDLLCGDYVFFDPYAARAWSQSPVASKAATATLVEGSPAAPEDEDLDEVDPLAASSNSSVGVVRAVFARHSQVERGYLQRAKLSSEKKGDDRQTDLYIARGNPICANVDHMIIVCAAEGQPPISTHQINRYLCVADRMGVDATIVYNKVDLIEKVNARLKIQDELNAKIKAIKKKYKQMGGGKRVRKEMQEEIEQLKEEYRNHPLLTGSVKSNDTDEVQDNGSDTRVRGRDNAEEEEASHTSDYEGSEDEDWEEEYQRYEDTLRLEKWASKKSKQRGDEVERILQEYEALGYKVVRTSALEGIGLDELKKVIASHHTSVMVGPSGVGKSSLLNQLVPDLKLRTNALNLSGRGRHTTTASTLYHLPSGGSLIDSPGGQSFVPPPIQPNDVPSAFPEIAAAANFCKYDKQCTHVDEPGCAVREAAQLPEIERRVTLADLISDPQRKTARVRNFFRDIAEGKFDHINPDETNDPAVLFALRYQYELSTGGYGSHRFEEADVAMNMVQQADDGLDEDHEDATGYIHPKAPMRERYVERERKVSRLPSPDHFFIPQHRYESYLTCFKLMQNTASVKKIKTPSLSRQLEAEAEKLLRKRQAAQEQLREKLEMEREEKRMEREQKGKNAFASETFREFI